MAHIHVSMVQLAVNFAGVLVLGFLWRYLAFQFSERPIGQAMAFVY